MPNKGTPVSHVKFRRRMGDWLTAAREDRHTGPRPHGAGTAQSPRQRRPGHASGRSALLARFDVDLSLATPACPPIQALRPIARAVGRECSPSGSAAHHPVHMDRPL